MAHLPRVTGSRIAMMSKIGNVKKKSRGGQITSIASPGPSFSG